MSCLVLDCSMIMAWFFEDEEDPRIDATMTHLSSGEAIVPNHWPLEVANVLLVAERKIRTSYGRIARFVAAIGKLPITVDDQTATRALGDVLALARAHRLTAYDAAYLELALRKGCPLASLDCELNQAAASVGIDLVTA